MIVCYAGLPGSGKSYSVVENVIIPALRSARHVAHNLELRLEGLTEILGFNPAHLLHQFDKDASAAEVIEACPLGAVIVIDEVWRYWKAGTKVNAVPQDEIKFFKEHRHRVGDDGLASEIVIIDQDPKTGFPAFIRALVDETYLHSKLDKVGMKNKFRVDVYSRAQSAELPSKSAKLRELYGAYKPAIFACYRSHTQSTRPNEAGLEIAADGRANILKSYTVKAALASVLLTPFLVWFALARFMAIAESDGHVTPAPEVVKHAVEREIAKTDGLAKEPGNGWEQVAIEPPKPTPVPTPARPPTIIEPDWEHVAKLPLLSKKWRIVGLAFRPDRGKGMAYLASVGGFRRIPMEFCTADEVGDWRCGVEDGFATFYSAVDVDNPLNAGRVPGALDQNVPLKGQAVAM